MTDLHTSTNEDLPNGQLMHLALEVMDKVAESPQNINQIGSLTYDIRDDALPPVCAL
jgi:hypothetical protein